MIQGSSKIPPIFVSADAIDGKSDFSSQASYEVEKLAAAEPPSPKRPDPTFLNHLPVSQALQKKQVRNLISVAFVINGIFEQSYYVLCPSMTKVSLLLTGLFWFSFSGCLQNNFWTLEHHAID